MIDEEDTGDTDEAAGESGQLRAAFGERDAERALLVESWDGGGGLEPITSRPVRDAMRRVPRHVFVPEPVRTLAYLDRPLPIGEGQTISQPYIVALMTQMLALQPGDRVLEVGTGSGYQAAVLAEVGADVYSIELLEPLGRHAEHVLRGLGYDAVHLRIGDGYAGWPEAAPFRAIIVTCAPEAIPRPLLDQLAIGGRMVIPTGEEGGEQWLVLVTKNADGSVRQEPRIPVRFVPMRGRAEEGR